jgi:hypothetical protein
MVDARFAGFSVSDPAVWRPKERVYPLMTPAQESLNKVVLLNGMG